MDVGVSFEVGPVSGSISIGSTAIPNLDLKRNNITVAGSLDASVSAPITPFVTIGFKPYATDLPDNNGWQNSASCGSLMYWTQSDPYKLSFEPSAGCKAESSYTWEWDEK